MLSFILAFKNLMGAKLRTGLNVLVLSFAYVAIIASQGIYDGMNVQGTQLRIETELAGGQFWHKDYDPYDPFTLEDAHAPVPAGLDAALENGEIEPLFIQKATIYPEGEILSVLMKGIRPQQKILKMPTAVLIENPDEIPVLIGSRMARESNLKKGDYFTIRWRDSHGAYDARTAQVVHVMKTSVQNVDVGQLWLPLETMRSLLDASNEATMLVVAPGKNYRLDAKTWKFQTLDDLLADLRAMVKQKKLGSSFMFVVLLFLAMIAIFDSQILSIFRRRKEIGTLIALGMTRGRVVRLFTLEGAMHGLLAALAGAIYGIPLLIWFAQVGWALPASTDEYGIAIGDVLYPVFSFMLVAATVTIVMLTVLIVSYLPARRISKMNPVDALRGKLA